MTLNCLAHLLFTIMSKSHESLSDLVEKSAKKVARSQAERHEDEHNWRCGYSNLHEGALGDYPNE